tara:strand:+ start:1074 stop:1661 length:588 start_codon:yes stop_codon:yes gene_type:complete
MKKYFFILLVFNFLISSDKSDWNILSEGPVLIKVMETDYPHCQSEIIIDDSISNILKVIEDVNSYKSFFDSIVISDMNDSEVVRLGIDMPFPFSDRDYTVKFNRLEDDKKISYLYNPIVSDNFPEDKNYIRLIDAKGGWILESIGNNRTLVIYQWNGDMRGDFPSWAYSRAWVKQGNEIMLNLEQEVKRRNKLND